MQTNCAINIFVSTLSAVSQPNRSLHVQPQSVSVGRPDMVYWLYFLTKFNILSNSLARYLQRERERERERETRDQYIIRISRTRAKYKNKFSKFIQNPQHFFNNRCGFFIVLPFKINTPMT